MVTVIGNLAVFHLDMYDKVSAFAEDVKRTIVGGTVGVIMWNDKTIAAIASPESVKIDINLDVSGNP